VQRGDQLRVADLVGARLDRDERVAPDRERLDERERGQPDERGGEREPRRATALQPDRESEREEHDAVREDDDGEVLVEELAHASARRPMRRRLNEKRRPGKRSPPAAASVGGGPFGRRLYPLSGAGRP